MKIQESRRKIKIMSNENLDALCKHCGQAVTDFLHQMEEHNAEVVCPTCGKAQSDVRPEARTKGAATDLTESSALGQLSDGNGSHGDPRKTSSPKA
jgi:uncharacterized Zn finger protein (UPF0148 family)